MKIWASSCPAKIVLFGEWGVLKGAPAIATTVAARFKAEIAEFEDSSSFKFSDASPDAPIAPFKIANLDDDSKIPSEWKHAARDLKFLSNHFSISPFGWHIKLCRDWKISEGYGSSSALSLSLYAAVKSKLDPHFQIPSESSERARYFENSSEIGDLIDLDRGSGIDFAAQWMGGSVVYQKSETHRSVKQITLNFPEDLVILHTGKKVETREAIKSSDFVLALTKKIAASVEGFLQTQDWERAMDQHFQIFKDTPVVPNWIGELRDELLAKKICTALKTTGAGGGDALLVLLQKNKRQEFSEWARKYSFWLGSYPFHAEGAALS